ncbi:MAG: hypothetical protein HY934_07745 [Candidatus Firestonebacteria bacterium]|nr:hypothetical protein [Candidatus Firestonebacteria bacterium]
MKKIIVITIIIIVIFSSNIFASSWKETKYIEQVLDSTTESNISAAYSVGLPYPNIAFAYGGNTGLYYQYYDTALNEWKTNIIEKGENIGKHVSLQINSQGKPYICYFDENRQCLKYAYYDSIWNIRTLDEDPEAGRFSVMQLDKFQNPHISYYDAKKGELKYIYYNGTDWKKEIIDKAPYKMLGLYIGFKIDKENNRHISYYDATDDDLKYAYYDGYNWKIEIVDTTGITGLYTSLTLDKNNQPHMSYYSNGKLKYAYKDYWQWKQEIVDSTSGAGMYRSRIIVDDENTKHIFYYINEYDYNLVINRKIKYAYYKDGIWNFINIKSRIFYEYNNNLDFDVIEDTNNELWLFYSCKEYFPWRWEIHWVTKVIRPEFKIYKNWASKKILDKSLGWHTFDMDREGNPHIVYSYVYKYVYNDYNYDYIWNEELWHSWYNNINGWQKEKIEKIDKSYILSAYNPILQIDPSEQMHLVYYSHVSGNNFDSTYLTYAEKKGTTWEGIKIKENIDKRGGRINLFLKDDIPYISYYNSKLNVEVTYRDEQGLWQSYVYDTNYIADTLYGEASYFDFLIDNQNKRNLAYSQTYNLYYTIEENYDTWKTPFRVDRDLEPRIFVQNISLKIGENDKKHIVYKKYYDPTHEYPYRMYLSGIKDGYAWSIDGRNYWGRKDFGDYIYRLSILELTDQDEPCFIAHNGDEKLYFCHLTEDKWKREYIKDVGLFEGVHTSFKLYKNFPGFLIPIYDGNYNLGLEYCINFSLKISKREQIGRTVIFDCLIDGPKGIKVNEYQWNFEGSRGIQFRTNLPYASYTYPGSGTFNARVTAVMEDGARIIAFYNVKVE